MPSTLLSNRKRVLNTLDAFPDSFLHLVDDEQRISLSIYRLLGQAEPVPPVNVARHCGVAEDRVRERLDAWPGVYRDNEGSIVGYWGLAIAEMTHRLFLADRTVYAWCAWDALFIPELLGEPARVTSKSPVSGDPVHLAVSPDHVDSATNMYVSFLEPEEGKLTEDVIGSFCHYVHFFPSVDEGRQWVADHPGTFLLTLAHAFELGRRKNARQYPNLLHPRDS